jgi:hypothetical protein
MASHQFYAEQDFVPDLGLKWLIYLDAHDSPRITQIEASWNIRVQASHEMLMRGKGVVNGRGLHLRP